MVLSKLNLLYSQFKANLWLRYFAVFCRVMLALSFIPSGIVKIRGERFTALPSNHPLGHYFDALFITGYYYTFLGVSQLLIALLLLIPRTAVLGALMYFPVILNICVLAYAVRFEGTRITTMMLMASMFLLVWYYDRIKHILPFKKSEPVNSPVDKSPVNKKFALVFFGCVIGAIALVVIINQHLYDIRPGNSKLECTNGCPGNKNPQACATFCDCIYEQGKPLDTCLAAYDRANAVIAK